MDGRADDGERSNVAAAHRLDPRNVGNRQHGRRLGAAALVALGVAEGAARLVDEKVALVPRAAGGLLLEPAVEAVLHHRRHFDAVVLELLRGGRVGAGGGRARLRRVVAVGEVVDIVIALAVVAVSAARKGGGADELRWRGIERAR